MTSAAAPGSHVYYPQYCFHLSPTINRWCPLAARDIQALTRHPGFEGQDDIFFQLNHPIRWVRIVGVVVAIDEYNGRWIYTVDDSTGVCIECTIMPPRTQPKQADSAGKESKESSTDLIAVQDTNPFPDIDVGMVIDVKGSLKLFRDQKQIKIEKVQHIRSTNQEVQFWNKIKDFKTEVLSNPWILEKKVVRKLEKKNKTDAVDKKHKKGEGSKTSEDGSSTGHLEHISRTKDLTGGSSLKRPYRPSKLRMVTTAAEGQYDALGL